MSELEGRHLPTILSAVLPQETTKTGRSQNPSGKQGPRVFTPKESLGRGEGHCPFKSEHYQLSEHILKGRRQGVQSLET